MHAEQVFPAIRRCLSELDLAGQDDVQLVASVALGEQALTTVQLDVDDAGSQRGGVLCTECLKQRRLTEYVFSVSHDPSFGPTTLWCPFLVYVIRGSIGDAGRSCWPAVPGWPRSAPRPPRRL